MAAEKRGSIAFFTTYRPPVPLDIYSCLVVYPYKPIPEVLKMTDGEHYNYNGQVIPSAALKTLLKRQKLASEGTEADVDSGRLSGMIFVSERQHLETLHIALHYIDKPLKVFSLADVFGKSTFSGVRLEDSGCFAGDYLIYVSTKDPSPRRRQPWTAVYRTNINTGETDRLTPKETADLSPSVSPCGKHILVASFEQKGGWSGEIEDLQTDILLINIEKPSERTLLVENGGWPTWGSDNAIFFHRKDSPKNPSDADQEFWGVYRFDISNKVETRVTPEGIDAVTPAAIDATRVAVATTRKKSKFLDIRKEAQYRHIEVFDSTGKESIKITQNNRPEADHFNPFVIDAGEHTLHIGYHRCRDGLDMEKQFQKIDSPNPDIGLFRVTGVFPTFNKDGSMLAFVDNDFKSVWVAGPGKDGFQLAYQEEGPDMIWSPVWNQNPEKDTLYVCVGPSFQKDKSVVISAIPHVSRLFLDNSHVSRFKRQRKQLTKGFSSALPNRNYNSAFPSSSPDGGRFVFRSVREDGFKNLYIMEDAAKGELEGSVVTRLTHGNWVDTHSQWSPSGDWIVFSSTRDKPKDPQTVPEPDYGLDSGYFAVFLVNAKNPDVVIRVVGSGNDLVGHVNHPFFSPDGKSIVVVADLAAVSVDPISLPLFLHSVRPYGDIFTIDIDSDDINKNKDLSNFTRITHSRYENSTAAWTAFSTDDPNAAWNKFINRDMTWPPLQRALMLHADGGESWHMTGHLVLPKRCC